MGTLSSAVLPRLLAVTAAAALLVTAAPAPEVQAVDPAPEQQIVEKLERLINYPRTGRGLPAVQVHLDTRAHAREWSVGMARRGQLAHDPSLGSRVPADARVWGEVVGRTTSPEDAALVIRNAWFRSDPHRRVLLDPRLTHVGVGIAKAAPYTYATARFWG